MSGLSNKEETELIRDALRYRWLREQHWSESEVAVILDPKVNVKLGTDCPSGERLDNMIDAKLGICSKENQRKRHFCHQTIQRCYVLRDEMFGPVHAVKTQDETLCGVSTSQANKWWVLNGSDDQVTCKKCIRILEENQ